MSIYHVLQAMDTGLQILVTADSLREGEPQVPGFMAPVPVTIFDKTLKDARAGFILKKGDFPQHEWVRNPRKFLMMLDYEETMLFTQGTQNIDAFGKGLVTTCLRQGFNISRVTHIVVVDTGADGLSAKKHHAFRAFETKQIRKV